MGRSSVLLEALPRPMKVAGFTAAGAVRERMRYGRSLDRKVAQAFEREEWTDAEWDDWFATVIPRLLHAASRDVPAYRRYWDQQRRLGRTADVGDLSAWPVLRRESVRADAASFVSERAPRIARFVDQTSGSTGSPLRVVSGLGVQRNWYALVEARMRRWNGVSRTDRWAIFGGRMVAPVSQSEPPYWIWNAAMNQLYCSAYHIGPRSAEAYLEALRRHRVTYLVGYPSALAALAECVLEQDLEAPQMQTVITNAEPVLDYQRAAIEQCFATEVRNTYGMAELVAAGSECTSGSMHLWPEVGHVEVLDMEADSPAPVGSTGRLVLTGVINPAMPLVRYEIGDLAKPSVAPERCRCGRLLPISPQIEGRLDDVVTTADGRRVGRLDKIITPDLPVREVQIAQESLEHFTIRVVPTTEWGDEHATVLSDSLRSRVGDVTVEVVTVDSIERTKNGKFRTVVSRIDSTRPLRHGPPPPKSP